MHLLSLERRVVVITPGTRERPQAAWRERPHDDPRLKYGGDEEAMVYAQVGQHPLARATETSPKRSCTVELRASLLVVLFERAAS